MLTVQDYRALAAYLVDRHGARALAYADQAIAELDAQGETRRAEAWRALRALVDDMVRGILAPRERITLH